MKKKIILSGFALLLLAAGCGSSSNNSPQSKNSDKSTLAENSTGAVAGAGTYTMEQVRQANSASKCWTVINGNVYDLTSFINKHPGGPSQIMSICGKDGTSTFESQHGGQNQPEQQLSRLQIGTLQ